MNGLTRIEMDALNAVRDINRKMKDQREIDWEQRRYEVARDAMCAFFSNSNRDICCGKWEGQAQDAVDAADALIAELKKGGEK